MSMPERQGDLTLLTWMRLLYLPPYMMHSFSTKSEVLNDFTSKSNLLKAISVSLKMLKVQLFTSYLSEQF